MTTFFRNIKIQRVILSIGILIALTLLTYFLKNHIWNTQFQHQEYVPPAKFKIHSKAKNLIFIIGDGMGTEQIDAASLFRYGSRGKLSFQNFPYHTRVKTVSKNEAITDSAAAASAMASGHKFNNGEISFLSKENSYATQLEHCQQLGKKTALITTDSITGATPGAFASHVQSRYMTADIADQYLNHSRPDVLLGGQDINLHQKNVTAAGYSYVKTREELLESSTLKNEQKILGLFGYTTLPYVANRDANIPSLRDMIEFSLNRFSSHKNGFCIFAEAGRIDHAGHENNIEYLIGEVLELDSVVVFLLEHWLAKNPDTLLIIAADHETGGLKVEDATSPTHLEELPRVTWQTSGHTPIDAPVFVSGKNAKYFLQAKDNTDIFSIIYHSL